MYKILVIEDDLTIASIIEERLGRWGYQIQRVTDFQSVLAQFTAFEPHLVLMDINLPYFDGYYWCGKVRELSSLPILFISSRESDSDKIRAITQGGDDYLEKPFSMDLLVAKVQAVIRRAYAYRDQNLNLLQVRDLIFDPERLQVFGGEEPVELTPNEAKILALLLRNPGTPVSRTRLMKALWDDESFVDENTLTVNVNRLRKRLQTIGFDDYIRTIKGEGYAIK